METARADAAALRERVIARHPRAREIEQQMAYAAVEVSRAILDGGNVEAAVETIKNHNLALQAELAALIAEEGGRVPNFEPQYTCPRCEDTGVAYGQRCACMESLLKEEACRRLSRMGSLKLTDFASLRLEYYPAEPDRTGVSPGTDDLHPPLLPGVRRGFPLRQRRVFPSLLMAGPTGVGKTHVSLAIARTVSDKGFGVVYGPAQGLLHQLEREHFGRAEGSTEELLTGCDLLILDDFGTEFSSPFYTACIYNLVNTRMLEERPTILSTNLGREDMLDRYGNRSPPVSSAPMCPWLSAAGISVSLSSGNGWRADDRFSYKRKNYKTDTLVDFFRGIQYNDVVNFGNERLGRTWRKPRNDSVWAA